jgi:hypothetical protein
MNIFHKMLFLDNTLIYTNYDPLKETLNKIIYVCYFIILLYYYLFFFGYTNFVYLYFWISFINNIIQIYLFSDDVHFR